MENWTKTMEENLGVTVEHYEYQHLMPELPPLRPIKIKLIGDDEDT